MARKSPLQKYSVLRERRTVMAVDADVHALAVAHATRNNITVRQAAGELMLAGVAHLEALKAAEKANPPRVLLPTETTD